MDDETKNSNCQALIGLQLCGCKSVHHKKIWAEKCSFSSQGLNLKKVSSIIGVHKKINPDEHPSTTFFVGIKTLNLINYYPLNWFTKNLEHTVFSWLFEVVRVLESFLDRGYPGYPYHSSL